MTWNSCGVQQLLISSVCLITINKKLASQLQHIYFGISDAIVPSFPTRFPMILTKYFNNFSLQKSDLK
jgi:hypothetical protein